MKQLSLFLLFLLASFSLLSQNLTTRPYFQSTSPTSMLIKWQTAYPTETKLWVGTHPEQLDLIRFDPQATRDHAITIENLQPATKYFYGIGTQHTMLEGATENHYFKTQPAVNTEPSIRTWLLGDCGTGNDEQREVRDAFYQKPESNEVDLVFLLGDNAYYDGARHEYQQNFFDIYEDILTRAELWSCPGNHDYHSCDVHHESGPYFDLFDFPKAAELGGEPSTTERYYSMDYGNIHFVVLDFYGSLTQEDSPQLEWLENDLAQNDKTWTIAFIHGPPYSKGSHDSNEDIELINTRENILPILEAGGTDLVLSGHSHSYERSYLINGHYDYSYTFSDQMVVDHGDGKKDGDGAYLKHSEGVQPNRGTVYAVVGSSGKRNEANLNHPAMYYSSASLGSAVLDVQGDELNFEFINNEGMVEDYFTILKDHTPVDNDGDGILSNIDCDDENPLLPKDPGTPCDDINPETVDDLILADGCTCQGTPIIVYDFCEIEATHPWHEWITGITLNDLNHTSEKSTYSDFRNNVATLSLGANYDFNLKIGFSYFSFTEYCRVWIDYNQNGIFEEPSEIAFSKILPELPHGSYEGILNGSIEIPASANLGNTVMRVSIRRDQFATPCGDYTFGEIEDYTISIDNNSEIDIEEEYCESISDFPYHDYIGRVKINELDHSSGKSSYSDFTDFSTPLIIGEDYEISLTTNFSYYTFSENWKIWIDYNQNQVFEEPDEIAFEGTSMPPPSGTPSQTLNGNIQLSGFVSPGLTRMRVAMSRIEEFDPCENLEFGEIEDFTVILTNENYLLAGNRSPKIEDRNESNNPTIHIYPNPAKSHITISTSSEDYKIIKIFSLQGQQVKTIQMDSSIKTINISDLIPGVYTVSLMGDAGIAVRRIVVGMH